MILLGSALTLLVCAAAFWKGGPPERAVALAGLAALVFSLFGQLLLGRTSALPVVAADGVLGLGIVVSAALYAQRWIYIEVGLAAGLLFAHGFLLDGEATVTPLYRLLVNSMNIAMTAVLVWAIWRNCRRARA